ncbi:MAG: GNAT family N-acetyltransferase [Mariprofundaceae bacterium]|nr:GNAT family N-acetyltransferase [Mariprofundaceae bacterium]
MKSIDIRPAYADDFTAMHALNLQSFREAWSEDAMRGALLGGFDVLVAAHNHVLCGYILSCDTVDEVHIMQLAVHPAWQRQGIAACLSKTLLQIKSTMACMLLELRASNGAALSLYQGLGFFVCGERANYYTARGVHDAENAILMRLNMEGKHE